MIIGQYQLGEAIGEGGFGKVYKAINLESGEFVAVKSIPLSRIPKSELSSTLIEIDLLKKLDNPYIVKYLGSAKTKTHLYIILEFIECGSLQKVLKKFKKLTETLVAKYIFQTLKGLVYLHEQGVIHRDIKGANLLSTKEGYIKLTDFGVSTTLGKIDNDSAALGTPYWMAPEVVELQPSATSCDIWSVGCTVIELLTGKPPYFDLAPVQALYKIVQDDCPPIPEGVSPNCRSFLLECFQKDPNLRIGARRLIKHSWMKKAEKDWKKTKDTEKENESDEEDFNFSEEDEIKNQKDQELDSFDSSNDFGDMDGFGDIGNLKPLKLNNQFGKSIRDDLMGGFDELDDDDDEANLTKLKGEINLKNGDGKNRLDLWKEKSNSDETSDSDSDDQDFEQNKKSLKSGTRNNQKDIIKKYEEKDSEESDWGEMIGSGDDKADTKGGINTDFAQKLKNKIKEQKHQTKTVKREKSKDFNSDSEDINFDLESSEKENDKEHTGKNEECERHQRQGRTVISLIESLKPSSTEQNILRVCDNLCVIFQHLPRTKDFLIQYHGVIPILEMLEVENPLILHSILRVVNQIMDNNENIQENLCLVGGVPLIMKFASKNYSNEIREQASQFIHQACMSSSLTLQMFIACRVLPVLVDLLKVNYKNHKPIVLRAIQNINAVFRLQSQTPKNDFCRLFVKAGLLSPLLDVYQRVMEDTEEGMSKVLLNLSKLLFTFSQADTIVKIHFSDNRVLKKLFKLLPNIEDSEILSLMLKSIKNISFLLETQENLVRNGVIKVLIIILNEQKAAKSKRLTEFQILSTMFNLCKVNSKRQEESAKAVIIPHLQQIIYDETSAKHFAFPIICLLAKSSRETRKELAKYDGVNFYMYVLKFGYWRIHALDAIATWLKDSKSVVEPILLNQKKYILTLVKLLTETSTYLLGNILKPFLTIVGLSVDLNKKLTKYGIVPVIKSHLNHKNADVRIDLLKILFSLVKHGDQKIILKEFSFESLKRLKEREKSVIAQNMLGLIQDLIYPSKSNQKSLKKKSDRKAIEEIDIDSFQKKIKRNSGEKEKRNVHKKKKHKHTRKSSKLHSKKH
ncbi:mtk1/mekk4 [Anaeramoeba flamelloides]|uniref:non-specific serine/threonine protein kinase n=1 Tax=Anaeramoeba flamelloides TaxID=1746091 RepID=A0AAV8A1F3_9EUKA|nr:mtk1/mekk4 [Anaeramoeba flamelloides]